MVQTYYLTSLPARPCGHRFAAQQRQENTKALRDAHLFDRAARCLRSAAGILAEGNEDFGKKYDNQEHRGEKCSATRLPRHLPFLHFPFNFLCPLSSARPSRTNLTQINTFCTTTTTRAICYLIITYVDKEGFAPAGQNREAVQNLPQTRGPPATAKRPPAAALAG